MFKMIANRSSGKTTGFNNSKLLNTLILQERGFLTNE